jgi:C4-dicarboxylate transporter DctQ subunit
MTSPNSWSASLQTGQRAVSRLNRWIALTVFVLASALLVFLSVTLFIQVLFRYVIKAPLPWTEEAARFALVWYGMLAAAAGAWTGQHFIFRWATLLLGDRARLILRLIVTVLTLVMIAVLIVLSWDYVKVFAGQIATATHIDMRLAFAGIPIGLSCFFLIYLLDLIDGLLSLWTGRTLSLREAREAEIYLQLKGRSRRSDSARKIEAG